MLTHVDDRIKAAGVSANEQRSTPAASWNSTSTPSFSARALAQFHVQAGQLAVIIVVGERRVGSFDTDDQLAGGLDFFQLVFTGGFRPWRRRCRWRVPARRSAAAAAGQARAAVKVSAASAAADFFKIFFMVVSPLSFLYVLVFRFGGSTHPNR